MDLTSTPSVARRQPAKRKKKPPACDSCKARRVLCHPQPEGIPCPRCAEKGIICKTTPVIRGRPRKPSEEVVSPSASDPGPSSSGHNESLNESIVTIRPHLELSDAPELPPELVKHLFECLDHLPEWRHPLFAGEKLKAAITSVSWQLNLLPLQSRVLASCVCALSASISFHSTIIGPSDIKSFTDHSVFFLGADLRTYGVRRAPVYRALYERAFTLACEARIHIDVSEDNAASCFFLDVLERLSAATTRPWAVAYVSHSRILAGRREAAEPHDQLIWNGFIMSEALAATARRTPVLFTYNDQLLMSGSEPPPLEQLLQSLQGMFQASKKVSSVIFSAIRPYMFHVTLLARDLYEKITGDYARRHPMAEAAVIQFLSSLSILQSIVTLILTQPEFSVAGDPLFYESPVQSPLIRRESDNVRACMFAMAVGFTGLALSLYKEIERRVSTDPPTMQNRWIQERMGTIQRQVHEMASLAAGDIARALQLLPSLPHFSHLDLSTIQDWADFYLADAAKTGSIDPARVKIFEIFITSFKTFGYSFEIPRSGELIERMEAYIAPATLSPSSALAQLFPLDNGWTGVFNINQLESDLISYDSGPTLGFQ
ncbi:hypothetical protein DFH08DRAFT_285472 [Mycena albidolilacea]|uniref:Zn(2)-C6 fungal-type domain-containing protein n=1 Tax=Mycena albidolilacea TaxID=1033008 RepID=A0AAD7EL12_9AGAR|nr:hypothetical protein DFH08DRAFT_285472 [Mycena albidolilacea]